MIKILKAGINLLLEYQPDQFNDAKWLDYKLEQDGSVTLRRTFTFTIKDLISSSQQDDEDDNERVFNLGVKMDGYYKINKEILGLKHDLLLHMDLKFELRIFIANRNISIFRKIDELIEEAIVVGGNNKNAIPQDDFEKILKSFPTTTELTHYSRSRIARELKDYFGTLSDAEKQLNNYLEKKPAIVTKTSQGSRLIQKFEIQKFEYILAELKRMLNDVDSYKEKVWQEKIIELLLFIFPKYIAVLENVHIKDFYSKYDKVSKRYIDLMLVDANGNIDIIEVKKPFPNTLLSHRKYRDNHTPGNVLSGTIMQAEKYLFHLSKWGYAGEQEIYKKRKKELPKGITLKIANPKALLLLGRDNEFTNEQHFDFEIIRRKYANVMDIMTYDDLIRRLKNIISMMVKHMPDESVSDSVRVL